MRVKLQEIEKKAKHGRQANRKQVRKHQNLSSAATYGMIFFFSAIPLAFTRNPPSYTLGRFPAAQASWQTGWQADMRQLLLPSARF